MSLVVALVLLPVLVIVAAQFGAFSGSPPADLGVKDGKLKPPSGTPNSVTSQAGLWPDHPQARRAAIEPLRYTGDGKVALQKVAAIVKAMERTTIVKQEPGYLYAQCTTRLMRYTDDLEFWLDEPAAVGQPHRPWRPRRQPRPGGGHPPPLHQRLKVAATRMDAA